MASYLSTDHLVLTNVFTHTIGMKTVYDRYEQCYSNGDDYDSLIWIMVTLMDLRGASASS
jgi:hypothetical protein